MRIIHSKLFGVTSVVHVNFFPGMNTLSDAEFEFVNKRDDFKEMVRAGKYIIGGKTDSETSNAVEKKLDPKERSAEIAKEIASMSAAEAKKTVQTVSDVLVLKALKEMDGRKGIQEAVLARLNSISKQEGSDLTPETKVAPAGDGSDFVDKIGTGKQDLEGGKGLSAIPALN